MSLSVSLSARLSLCLSVSVPLCVCVSLCLSLPIQIWSAQTVVRYLIALVKKAGIDMSRRAGEEKEDVPVNDEIHPFFTKLGYFAMTGLLRVHCLLCDYQSALQVLDPIDLRKQKGIFTELLACHVTLYYYLVSHTHTCTCTCKHAHTYTVEPMLFYFYNPCFN